MSSPAAALAAALAKGKFESDTIKDHGCWLSTGVPNVDAALSGKYRNGGFKSARVVELAGEASTGKTLLAQHVAKEAQKAGGAAIFLDHERSFMEHLFERFGGSIEPGAWSYKRPRSLEESLDNAVDWMQLIRQSDAVPFEAPLVAIFDSAAMMVPLNQLDRDMSVARNMRDKLQQVQAFSQELPAFTQFCEENNILAIFLNQIRIDPSVTHGDNRKTPGGNALYHADAVKIYLGRSMDRENKDDKSQVTGQTIRFETVKNKTFRPFQKTKFKFKFDDEGTGYIDVIETMLIHLKDIGKLEMSGAYVVWEGKKKYISVLAQEMNLNPEESMQKLLDVAEA